MSSLNKVTLIGRVGKSPEVRNTGNGKPIVSFSIATSESWKDKQGQKQEKTEWHNVTCFNEGLCGVIEHHIQKGSKIYIEGKLVTEKYTDKNGVERYTTKVILENFNGKLILLDNKSSQNNETTEYNQNNFQSPLDDEEIPF